MAPGLSSGIEGSYVNRIDSRKERENSRGEGVHTEEFVAAFYDAIPGLQARFSTREEDKGGEIGGRQTVDLVISRDGKPLLATQVTGSTEKGVISKKLKEMADHPFIRLDEMKSTDMAIPKALVFLDAAQIKAVFKESNPDPKKHPELFLKVIDDHIRSLGFDLAKTQNPLEKKAVEELIQIFEQEKKKYIN